MNENLPARNPDGREKNRSNDLSADQSATALVRPVVPPDYADDIVKTLREPLVVLDADLRVKAASAAFYRVFHVRPEQTINRLIYELGDGQWDIPALRKLLDEVMQTSAAFDDYEVNHDFPDVGPRTMLLNARRLPPIGDIRLILLAIDDITARRRIERQLAEQARLLDLSYDAIIVRDVHSRITYWNQGAEQIFGYTAQEARGQVLHLLLRTEFEKPFHQLIGELRVKNRLIGEIVQYARDGRRRTLLCRWSLDHDASGRPGAILTTSTDITDRLSHEQTLRLEAEAANRAKDLFLATLSHELRTPLGAILGWASILENGAPDEGDLKEGLAVIKRNVKTQTQLIEDVLDVSRIVSGKLRLNMQPCDLTEAIRAAIDVMRPAADAKGVKLETALDPVAHEGLCDGSRMQQVLWNLLSNAVRFTPQGGTVRVTLSRERSITRITISDTGKGIAAEFLPHIFERFRQADSTTTRTSGGLGLGLSIVKHIVELHGGTIRAESDGENPPSGSTFIIELPIRAVRRIESTEATGDEHPTRRPQHSEGPIHTAMGIPGGSEPLTAERGKANEGEANEGEANGGERNGGKNRSTSTYGRTRRQ